MNDYRATLRPVGYGQVPDRTSAGQPITYEVITSYWPPRWLENGGYDYGTVRYAQPLDFDRIDRFSLQPLDPIEHGEFTFWHLSQKDKEVAREEIEEYLTYTDEELEQLSIGSGRIAVRASVMMAMKAAGYTGPTSRLTSETQTP